MDRLQRAALHRDMARLADGDREAFHPVFVVLWPLFRSFVGRHLPSAEAEDVAQDSLLKVFARVGEFDPQRDALSWALGVAAYEIKTARRRRQRRKEGPAPLEEPMDDRPGPEDALLAREMSDSLADLLGGMTEGDAATLVAFARDERPDVAGATFRKRLQRALGRLRAAWRAAHGRP